jgi:hypothetical protein
MGVTKMKKYLKYVCTALAISLTMVSLFTGFFFYINLFDLATALLANSTFEIIRLTTLYSLMKWELKRKLIAAPLYCLVAFVCASAAIASFYAKINDSHIKQRLPYEREITRRINIIKETYAQNYAESLSEIQKEIDRAQRNIASKQWSTYWPKRVEQLSHRHQQVFTERDSTLSYMPQDDAEVWISHHTAILKIKFEPLPVIKSGSGALTLAIQELLGVTELEAKKGVAIIITLGVELAIILISLFAKFYSKASTTPQAVIESTGKLNELLRQLQTSFNKADIKKFLEKALPYFIKTGKLLKSRELAKNLRPIRTMINKLNLDKNELSLFFNLLKF